MLRPLGSTFALVLLLLCSAPPARGQFPGSTFFAAGGPVTLTFESAGVSAPFGGAITSAQTYFLYRIDPSAVPVQLIASYLPADGPGLVIEGVPPGTYTVPLGSFASATALHFGIYSTLGDFWQYTARLEPAGFPPPVPSVRFEARDPITDAAGFFAFNLTGIEGVSGVIGVVPEPSTAALLVIGLLGVAGYARARPRAERPR